MIPIHVTNGDRVGVLEGIDRGGNLPGASCAGVDPEIFFPEPRRGVHGQLRVDWDTPRTICDSCPVKDACLQAALDRESAGARHRFGMWGGKTPDERAAMDPGQRRPRPVAHHGTEAGARRHRALHEKPCDACRLGERKARVEREARRAG